MPLNDLSGFPMVMAVSEDAINAQMAKVFGQSTHETDMFPHVPWKLGPEDGSWDLTVEQFAAPKVDFNTSNPMECRMLMTVLKGQFSTWVFKGMVGGKPNMEQQDVSLEGITIYVTTPMRQVKHDKWSDEVFEVQSLFADLENMKMIEFDLSAHTKLAVLGSVESELQNVLGDYIRGYGKVHPQALLFGAVRVPTVEQTTGLLTPSAVAFSTTATRSQSNAYESGNLNYLIWTGSPQSIPTSNLAGVFDSSLLRPGASATFVISEATVLDTIARSVIRADQDFANIDLALTHGIFGIDAPAAKLSLNAQLGFGVNLNGHSRAAQLRSIEATVEQNKIVVKYSIHTSVYGAFKDIDITVAASRDLTVHLEDGKIKVKVGMPYNVDYEEDWGSTWDDFDDICQFALWKEEDFCNDLLQNINVPGWAVFTFTSVELGADRQMYLNAMYE